MLPIIGLLASVLPDAVHLFTGADKKPLESAAKIVQTLTGTDGADAVDMINGSPELQLKLRKALMEDAHIADKMAYADRANARDMYAHHHSMQDDVAKSVMKYNLWFVFALVTANLVLIVAGIAYDIPATLGAASQAAGTLMGFIINALLKERQDLIGFNFGSSTGSKEKTAQLKAK